MGTHHATDLETSLSIAAAYIDDFVTFLNAKVLIGDVAVNLTITRQQMAKSIPLRYQYGIPAIDKPDIGQDVQSFFE